MNHNPSGLLKIRLSWMVLLLTSSILAGCSAKQVSPVLVFDEDMIYKTQPNESFPAKPYIVYHLSAKKMKEFTNP